MNDAVEWSWDRDEGVRINGMADVHKKHAQPMHSPADGWTCEFCGAESFDKDLFNEVGEMEECYERGKAAGVVTEDVMAAADVHRAKGWADQAKKANIEWKNTEYTAEAYRKLIEAIQKVSEETASKMTPAMEKLGKAAQTLESVSVNVKKENANKEALKNYHRMMANERLKHTR